jgi:hypothetical protein
MWRRYLVLFCLAAIGLAGCGSASKGEENWAYEGTDQSLRSPHTGPAGSMSAEARHAQLLESVEAWRLKNREALEAAKGACARETGDNRTPGAWRGYSDAFMACMKAKGWIRASNPS